MEELGTVEIQWRELDPEGIIVGGSGSWPLGTHPLSPPIRVGANRLQPSGIPVEHHLSLHGF